MLTVLEVRLRFSATSPFRSLRFCQAFVSLEFASLDSTVSAATS